MRATRSCCHLVEAYEESRKAKDPYLVLVQLVVAGGNLASMLHAVDEPLDPIAAWRRMVSGAGRYRTHCRGRRSRTPSLRRPTPLDRCRDAALRSGEVTLSFVGC